MFFPGGAACHGTGTAYSTACGKLSSMTATEPREKIRENRLRQSAARQGLRLEKSRRRDPRAYDYGTYHLVNAWTGELECYGTPNGYGLSLDEIEARLTQDPGPGGAPEH